MLPYLRDQWGNASSRDHRYGWDAADAIEEARARVADLIGAGHHEIAFTSGATESARLALDPFRGPLAGGGGLLVSAVEHEAVLSAARFAAARGIPVSRFGVDRDGGLERSALAAGLAAAEGRVRVVALMAANNETGVLFPIRDCAAEAHRQGALLFTDAAQALGKIALDAAADGFDLAAFSAHKLGGPKGAGALYVRGGPQGGLTGPGEGREPGMHAGTGNVPAIVGFGAACRLAKGEARAESARLAALRDRLEALLLASVPGAAVNGRGHARLPNTSSFRFPGVDARALLRAVPEVAASTRSACSSGDPGPSPVLLAMGLSDAEALSTVRFSLGPINGPRDIDAAAALFAAAWRRLAGA